MFKNKKLVYVEYCGERMQEYIAIFMKSRGYSPYDTIVCEECGQIAVDIHHIDGRSGELMTDPYNLVALCRKHHNMYGVKRREYSKYLRGIVKNKLDGYGDNISKNPFKL